MRQFTDARLTLAALPLSAPLIYNLYAGGLPGGVATSGRAAI